MNGDAPRAPGSEAPGSEAPGSEAPGSGTGGSRRLDGRVALVTGAGGGIGRAVATRLAAEGASVACLDVVPGAAGETAAVVVDRGGVALPLAGDVRDPVACRSAVTTAVEHLGGLDVLVNVAGVGAFARTGELTLDDWERTLAVNLTGTFLMSQQALDPLLAARGCIVNIGSAAGMRGLPFNAAYCASKGGVVLLTRAMAVEFAAAGLRVNCVCPSSVATAFLDGFRLPDGADLALLARSGPLLDGPARPDEVAAAVAYLSSGEARMITGTVLMLDGGATA